MADTHREVDALIDQVDEAIQHEKADRDGRVKVEEVVQYRAQDLFAEDRWCGDGQSSARSRALAARQHVGFFKIDQYAPAGCCIALARLAQLQRSSGPMQQLDTNMRLQKLSARLTAVGDRFRLRAAPARLPSSIAVTNTFIASMRSIVPPRGIVIARRRVFTRNWTEVNIGDETRKA